MTVLYDAGLLVAADRNDREVWADHRVRLELGVAPVTTAPVVSQVSRSGGQVQLRRLLRGCEIVDFLSEEMDEDGRSRRAPGSRKLVGRRRRARDPHRSSARLPGITADVTEMTRLSNCLRQPVTVRPVRARPS